ncbi:MAG: DUF1289 domain-containing protein [Steroidobacteraceae bacterium]
MAVPAPTSPCISVCTLDQRGVCQGCFRTLEEIAGWSRLDPARQWEVIKAADARRLASGAARAG